MKPTTVNQALDKLFSDYSSVEVAASPALTILKKELKHLKNERGGNYPLPDPDAVLSVLDAGRSAA